MVKGFRHSQWKLALGIALCAVGLPFSGQAQSPGDVIRIGNSPIEQSQYESYWNQLLNLSGPATPAATQGSGQDSNALSPASSATDPQVLEKELIRNLQISQTRLKPIIGLSGSSVLTGSITNRNKKAVTVSSVNFEIIGPDGSLVQTTSAVPEPATVQPGATVTFQKQLPSVPFRGRTVRLSKPAVAIQGGI